MAERKSFALFGHPVSHSRSPEIHRGFAQQFGESIEYTLVDVPQEQFENRVREFFTQGGAGANVTLPHKLAAFELADHLSSDAWRAGAVNTLAVLEDGKLFGDNTDGAGLVRDLVFNHGISLEGKRILLIGAGGAARGALGPLLDEGPAEIVVTNRRTEKAIELARLFEASGKVSAQPLSSITMKFDLVINATSASLHGQVPEISASVIGTHTCAYDMVYADEPTAFLAWAREQGAIRCIDGWGMMVEQAAESFFIWSGVRPQTADLLQRKT